MSQDTGKIISWLKHEGERVAKGDPIMEIETDKATVEIEAPATGILGGVRAGEGDVIPVGQTVAWLLAPGERAPEEEPMAYPARVDTQGVDAPVSAASPVALKLAKEHGIDLSDIKPREGRIEKADVLAYLERKKGVGLGPRLKPASPKARRLARERGLAIEDLNGSGPRGAILTDDVLAAEPISPLPQSLVIGSIWQRMAERVTQSWTSAPHFYLWREVNASRLASWRGRAMEWGEQKPTYTDLILRLVAVSLRDHPRVNAAWIDGKIILNNEINIGLAVATDDGLVVPVIHRADELDLNQIMTCRQELVSRAQAGKLRPSDISHGTFTISNLGMYGVDAFNPIINPPQAAILGIGRIADRVVPMDGESTVQPMMMMSLSFDHRVVDGARGAQFLGTLVELIEKPSAALNYDEGSDGEAE